MIGELGLGTFVVAILGLITLAFRSRIAAITSLVLTLLLGLLYFPWQAFAAATNDDPDWQSILSSWRFFAGCWVGVCILAILSTFWAFRRSVAGPPSPAPSEPQEEEEHEQDAFPTERCIAVSD
jgi:hypothetical protein